MAGTRQATATVLANGRKHLTQAEIDARLDAETALQRAAPVRKTAVRIPKWMPEQPGELRKEFRRLARELMAVGLWDESCGDSLGRYLISQVSWLNAQKRANDAIVRGDTDAAKDWSAVQERYFRQCRNTACDMGLTISSRCRLLLPVAGALPTYAPDDEPRSEFEQALRDRMDRAAVSG